MGTPSNDLNISQSGYVVFDGVSTFTGRTFQAGTGISLTNASGVSGNTTITATGSNDLHVARFIVASSTAGTGANFTTIAAAIASAQGTGINSTIFIQPGTYTENLTLVPGINLCAFDCDALTPNVTIVGTLTLTAAGTVSISGIRLQTNGAALLSVTGTLNSFVNLRNCFLNITNSTGIVYSSSGASSGINLTNCRGDLTATGIAIFSLSGSGGLTLNNCFFRNSGLSTTANTCSAGIINATYTQILNPLTMSATAGGTWEHSMIECNALNVTAATLGGSGLQSFKWTRFNGGTASAISISSSSDISFCSIDSTNTNAITGAGSIQFGNLIFLNTSSTINTTTQVPLIHTNNAKKVVTPGAYPYTTTPQDGLIKVDTSSARTITPLASPTTGQMHIIKDTVGSAAANNITVTPSGKNIDGAASFVINTNYASITICFTGTEWSIL
jgi:hypothetical protein